MDALKERIRHVPDFPKPGILFYDVTTLLKDAEGFRMAIDAMASPHREPASRPSSASRAADSFLEPRSPIDWNAGFAPVRKLGKLPSTTRRASYALDTARTPSKSTRTP